MHIDCSISLKIPFKAPNHEFAKFRKCKCCEFTAISPLLFLKHDCQELKCEHCERVLTSRRGLQRHIRSQHGVVSEWFRCCQCDYKTLHGSNLRLHAFRKHATKDNVTWLSCTECAYRTKIRNDLAKHLQRHARRENPAREGYKCVECPRVFKWRSSFQEHILRAHSSAEDDRWHKCEYCDHKALSKKHLKHHMLKTHIDSDEGWRKCTFCEFKTLHASTLKRHIVRKHTRDEDINWFQCLDCSFKTKIAAQLKSHMQWKHKRKDDVLDDGTVWFRCEHCEVKFKSKSTWKTHVLRNHATDDNGKLFSCSLCDYKHVHKSAIRNHMNSKHVENPMTCQYCGSVCKNEFALYRHIRNKKHPIKDKVRFKKKGKVKAEPL